LAVEQSQARACDPGRRTRPVSQPPPPAGGGRKGEPKEPIPALPGIGTLLGRGAADDLLAARPQPLDRGAPALDPGRCRRLEEILAPVLPAVDGHGGHRPHFLEGLFHFHGPSHRPDLPLHRAPLSLKVRHLALLEGPRLDRLPPGGALCPLRPFSKTAGRGRTAVVQLRGLRSPLPQPSTGAGRAGAGSAVFPTPASSIDPGEKTPRRPAGARRSRFREVTIRIY